MTSPCEGRPDGVWLHVRVQPRASRTEVVGVREGQLAVRLSAPPAEGAANQACQEVVADLLGVPKRDVALVRGPKSREKTFLIAGDPRTLAARFEAAMKSLGSR